ncbi:hypothetical protein [Paraburkholderia youngii]|uniref:hypothetical protein n=1 Tax=Paraburkholderia youngii TaxID=2782701 RepID=UPI003D2627F0
MTHQIQKIPEANISLMMRLMAQRSHVTLCCSGTSPGRFLSGVAYPSLRASSGNQIATLLSTAAFLWIANADQSPSRNNGVH